MKVLIYAVGALAAASIIAVVAAPARAQTAADINRLNQAMQICNSPMGQGMAECAKLRVQGGGGMSGLGGAAGMLGKFGGGKVGGMAGLLGSAVSAAQRGQAAPAAAPMASQGNAAEIQQAVAMCMRSAAGNQTAIQACLAIATGGAPAPAYAPAASYAPAPSVAPVAARTAAESSQAAYRACVSANPTNLGSCTYLLSEPR